MTAVIKTFLHANPTRRRGVAKACSQPLITHPQTLCLPVVAASVTPLSAARARMAVKHYYRAGGGCPEDDDDG
jgi:hypothetical protein